MQRQVPAVLRVRRPSDSVHRQSVGHSCYASVTCIRIAPLQVRGVHRSPVMDVPVITQLMFLQYFEDVEVPQFPSSTECSRFQLYYRVVYAQTTGACAGPDSAENREVSARVLGLGSLPVVVR